MNAKYSLFISRLVLLLAGAVLCARPLSAQQVWREGHNICGLALYDDTQVEARLGGIFTSGGYRLPSEAEQLWQATAEAEAETHYKDLLFVGSFSFNTQHGKGMMGSMFTTPDFYPVDLLEFTPGPKSRQTYNVGGGMVVTRHARWIPGFALQFEGVNYAKQKDLRHTTYRQVVQLTPSLFYKGDRWRAGATIIFNKNSEFVQAEQIGSATADTYYVFLDKGKRYGTYEAWDGGGIHLADPGVDRFAVTQTIWGLALQTSCGESFFAEAEYRHSHGLVGEKGYTWFRFPGQTLAGQAIWNIAGKTGVHTIQASANWTGYESYESVIDRVTAGGVTTPVIYGSNHIYRKRALAIQNAYAYESSAGWSLSATASVEWERDRGTHMYPFLEYDDGTVLRVGAQAHVPLGPFTLDGGLSVKKKVAQEHLLIDTDESEDGVVSRPARLQEWWDMEEEFRDVTTVGGFFNLRYNFVLARQNFYVEAGCQLVHAFQVTLLGGSKRQETHLTLGYHF